MDKELQLQQYGLEWYSTAPWPNLFKRFVIDKTIIVGNVCLIDLPP